MSLPNFKNSEHSPFLLEVHVSYTDLPLNAFLSWRERRLSCGTIVVP